MRKVFISFLVFMAITTNGQTILDTTFGTHGMFTVKAKRAVSLVETNGDIMVVGVDNSLGLLLTRYTSNGVIDSTFGTNGVVTNSDVGDNFINLSFAKQNNNYLIGCCSGVLRYTSDGHLDSSFATNGYIGTIKPGYIVVQNDHKILVSDVYGVLRRYTVDGYLDSSFNETGKFSTDSCTTFNNLTLDENQHIFVVGCKHNSKTSYDMVVCCLNSNGSINTNFGNNGFFKKDFGGADEASSILVENNNVIVAGFSAYYSGYIIFKLTLNGLLYTSFGDTGILKIPISNTGYTNNPKNLIKQNGLYYVGGRSTDGNSSTQDYGYIARFDSLGHIDSSFNRMGYFQARNMCHSIHLLTNGSMISTGDPGSGSWNTVYKYKAYPSLVFDSVALKTYGDNPFKLIATSNAPEINFTSSNSSVLSINNDTATIVGAGNVTVTAQTVSDTNFNAVSKSMNISIQKVLLEITPVDTFRKYGTSDPSVRFTYNGFKNNDKENSLNSKPNVIFSSNLNSSIGLYAIKLTGGNDNNYNYTFNEATLTIEKNDLECKAKDLEKNVGQSNPTFEIIYSGFKNADNEDSLIEKPVATSSVSENSPEGVYPITVSGGLAENYNLTLIDGSITVKKASSLDGVDHPSSLYIYPNPANNYFLINPHNLNIDNMELMDVYGKIVKHINPNQNYISVDNIPSGMYFVRFYSSGNRCIKKIIINHKE